MFHRREIRIEIPYSHSHIDFLWVGILGGFSSALYLMWVWLVDVVGGVPSFVAFHWFVVVFRWRDGSEKCMRAVVVVS